MQKAKTALLWVVTVIGALGYGGRWCDEVRISEMWNGLFTEWGYSIRFKVLIGILEVSGGVFVLVPRCAAALLCAILLGAIYTVLVKQSDLGIVAPMGDLVLFSVIAFVRHNDLWMAGV